MDERFLDARRNPMVDPVSWFNEFGTLEEIFKGVKGAYLIDDASVSNTMDINEPSFKLHGNEVMVCGHNEFDLATNMIVTKFMLLSHVRFKSNHYSAMSFVAFTLMKLDVPYIRVACDYFKLIRKPNRYGGDDLSIKAWKKDEIKQDEGKDFMRLIPKFADFTIVPDNISYSPIINNCYNLYSRFPHTPHPETVSLNHIPQTDILMNHIFGDQVELGYQYMKVLYEHPKQILPVLVMVSSTRETGKTTFLNWVDMIFGENSILITPGDLSSQHNSAYATKNILLIDETFIEKSEAAEKLKSLSTAKKITVDPKFVQQYSLPFFGKIIMSTNKELDFMRVDKEEIRYWIRKVPLIPEKNKNTNIEADLFAEIPKFLRYLADMPAIDFARSRMVFTRADIATEHLVDIQNESKSWLCKELEILIEDWFNNNDHEEMCATAIDVKKKWFSHNSKVDINYIRRVMRSEIKCLPPDSTIRYSPIYVEGGLVNTVGRPYKFKKSDFCHADVTQNSF